MERKEIQVNMEKTKFLVSGVGLHVPKKSSKYPRVVCCSGVGNNSIECSPWKLWIHKKYRSIIIRLVTDPIYICPRLNGKAGLIGSRLVIKVDVVGTMLNVDATIRDLDDMLWFTVLQGEKGLWKIWSKCVKDDVSKCGLDLQDRYAWRASVPCSLVLQTPSNRTWSAPKSKFG